MGDSENALPPSKKRAAGRELSRDNPGLDDDEDSSEQETGTFKKASDEVLASRRIVKVRRPPTTSTPSSNPFAGIRLVPSAEPSVTITTVTSEAVASNEKKDAEGSKSDASSNPSAEPSVTSTVVTTEAVASSEEKDAEGSKNDACQETEKGKDENSKQSESKVDEAAAEADASNEADKGEDESSKQSANKTDEPASVAVADRESDKYLENSAVVNEAAKDEVDNEKAAGVDKTENEDKKDKNEDKKDNEGEDTKDNSHENADASAEGSSLNSFQQLSSSQNAFTGLAGTGFSTTTFSFGSTPKDGSALGSSSGSLFGQKSDQPSFGFGLSNNGNSSLFNAPGASILSKSEGSGFPSMQEVVLETGEENEEVVFSADSVLFEFLDGSWKERGKGEIKVNVSTSATGRARLLMRTKGNYRLILNASLYPDMKLTNMEKKGITFACASEGKDGLSTFALKFKDCSMVDEFRAAVLAHKDKSAAVLKTPENSPKASDD
ncbi:hypothetical protein JRO89_XS09G0154300 [Xanthoceras sorbifolium]|uniref:RanBD1 domain-containing protein n=1 Tax=Xanthoceras sorbifolium TaxID=99658 RepID=A0ABQ8HLG1_9ROSI|nr:hypothetical protein JRO89_XS09G0154300 [Xanthoceras sorbifolium]